MLVKHAWSAPLVLLIGSVFALVACDEALSCPAIATPSIKGAVAASDGAAVVPDRMLLESPKGSVHACDVNADARYTCWGGSAGAATLTVYTGARQTRVALQLNAADACGLETTELDVTLPD
ncbi:MAG: hypothetical protein RL385_1156 [Pseudomonadota bacterium]|jgi:hypothetical protein